MTKCAEVAGGGIGGLSVAVLLARGGWRVRVHEQSPTLREIGAGVFLKNNARSVLQRMGLADGLLAGGVELRRASIFDANGRLLQRRQLVGSLTIIDVLRQSLLQSLATAAVEAGVVIETGSRVRGATAHGDLILESGEVATADLVIAADGHRSAVRESLGLTRSFRILAAGATRLLMPRESDNEVPEVREYWSGQRRVGITPCTATAAYVYLTCRNDDVDGAAVPIDSSVWMTAFPALAASLPAIGAIPATRTPYSLARVKSWRCGRVALVGDAAHALPPTLGQGAGMTLMNAWTLALALSAESEVERALELWEQRQRPLVERTQRWATRYSWLSASTPAWMSGGRSLLIALLGRIPGFNDYMRAVDAWSA